MVSDLLLRIWLLIGQPQKRGQVTFGLNAFLSIDTTVIFLLVFIELSYVLANYSQENY